MSALSTMKQRALRPGQIVAVNGKIYGRCAECDGIVRVDKCGGSVLMPGEGILVEHALKAPKRLKLKRNTCR